MGRRTWLFPLAIAACAMLAIEARADEGEELELLGTATAGLNARGREGLVVDFEERDFLQAGVTPRQLQPVAQGEPDVAPIREGSTRGLAPGNAPTQDRPTQR